ncbi:MFS family permease [Paeniglutamicibacter cryotolerans]|uniref:MFS family permease n=2 Tax=Paeniglutamicibacter cryotolerans TaxID=670079 RepID=A0A839QEA2_9MICC|nr:MFS family permease [Paeniglutamicibacter cryotolerans]
MNVSISAIVVDLRTTVGAMQSTITFYTLTMAAVMLLGAKLGDVWGRRRAFVIGAVVYGLGSLITGLSPNITVLFIGWAVIEGLGAVLVIPAIAALVAENYTGRDRVTAFAVLGAVSGAAVAAGPLIGGLVTTYSSWRFVFFGESVVIVLVLLVTRFVADRSRPVRIRIDVLSALLSAAGLVLIVVGMLQSKTWGWILPILPPTIGGVPITPLGLSPVPYVMAAGVVLLWWFLHRQKELVLAGRTPLLQVSMLSIPRLQSGLSVLSAQYAITAGLFFMVPIYLQMTLGLNALQTGIKIFPLSIALILFSVFGTWLSRRWSAKRIVRIGQLILVASSLFLLASVSVDLKGVAFGVGMFFAGAALGLLASQLGNVNMTSVPEQQSSEVGGLQGVMQNLGSSLGTALIGSILIASLGSVFLGSVNSSMLPESVQATVVQETNSGIAIIPATSVEAIAERVGLSPSDATELTNLYQRAQVSALRVSFASLAMISGIALLLSRNIPGTAPTQERKRMKRPTR